MENLPTIIEESELRVIDESFYNDAVLAVIISMNPFGGSKSVRCPQLIHLIEKQRIQNL